MSVIRINVTVAKIVNQFLLNILNLLRRFNTKFSIWVAYIKWQLGIATQVSVIKVKDTVAKIENNNTACKRY